MKILSFSDLEHIQAHKTWVRTLSLTKVLATKQLLSVDDLLDFAHEFINRKITIQSKRDHLESRLRYRKGKRPFQAYTVRPPEQERLFFSGQRPYQPPRL